MKYKYILAILLVSVMVVGAVAVSERNGKIPDISSWVKVKDNVELKTKLPDVPKEVPILKIDNKNLDQKGSGNIAEKVLGIKNTEIKSDNIRSVLGDKNNEETEITVYKRGQLKYSTGNEWKNMYKKEEMVGEKQAKDIAAGYIKKLADADLINKDMADTSKLEVIDDEIVAYNVKDGSTKTFASNRHVNLDLSYKGIPLSGAGAKVRIYTGKSGEVVGLLNSVGKVVPDKNVPIITPQDAIEKIKKDGYRDITIESIRLVYDVKSPEENVDYIKPAYDIQGHMHTPTGDAGFALIVPATK